MKEYIRGRHACPECGGTNFYCADCVDPEIEALRAVADAARALMDIDSDGDATALAAALDVLDGERGVATLYVDGGKWGSERADGGGAAPALDGGGDDTARCVCPSCGQSHDPKLHYGGTGDGTAH